MGKCPTMTTTEGGVVLQERSPRHHPPRTRQKLWSRRILRKQRGLTLQQVEVLSNKRLKGSLLAAYERGDRNISVTRLHQIATLYSVPVNQLLPEEIEGVGEPALPPKLAIDLTQLQGLPERQGSI